MQLKGLVRFLTILLTVYSLYMLSFTWFVNRHEKKLERSAHEYVKANNPLAKGEEYDTLYSARLRRLKDSTKDETITYGLTGPISYGKAQEEQLSLGLDLQGGMNVTLEVDMVEVLRKLANNSKDANFNQALHNANQRKANSDANFITLFSEEYVKLAGENKLAGLFSTANKDKIKIGDSDAKVRGVLQELALVAFDNTYSIMSKRIDQLGVAQPNINADRDRAIITVELPGVQDKERVRKQFQTVANLQFWELYDITELNTAFANADAAFYKAMGGKKADTTATSSQKEDSTLATLDDLDKTSTDTTAALTSEEEEARKHLYGYMAVSTQPHASPKTGRQRWPAEFAYVPVSDTALVRSFLNMPTVRNQFPSQLVWMYGLPRRDRKTNKLDNFVPLYAIKTFGRDKPKLEGDAVQDANSDFDPTTSEPIISLTMNPTGTRIWGEMTSANRDKPIAIALDNIVYTAPFVEDPILTGESRISGSFTVQEAKDLASTLRAGKLPAPAKIVQDQQVGPTLGAAAIKGGMLSFLISFIVIFILMLVYYNTSGWVANIALILNLLFTVGVLTALGATLTAPGIAGLVLTIGMAVDTNVIIYERIKEELARGKSYLTAVNDGYRRSLPPVLDGHITTMLTAIILFYFGLGPVKGFATTQILGLLLSLFCGILVSRWITEIFIKRKVELKYFTSISKNIFKHAQYKFVEFRKVAYIISFIVLALGIASFIHGFSYGVEFDGGRSYRVRFDKALSSADVEKVRDDMQQVFEGENPFIKTIGNSRTLEITTSYLINDPNTIAADSIVEHKLFEGLKPFLPDGYTYYQFANAEKSDVAAGKIGSNKVLPTISDDLKRGAFYATIFAVVLIFLYIFIRFRDWRYSLGTIVALLHDVTVMLIIFSFLKDIVPFPLEIDQHFIAALLTVIGFSMNDTVIIFDRIREDRTLYPTSPLAATINRAINETLSRTIMTSVTVFLTLLILFIVGGEVTRGFAFAMLIGVVTGIYSSVFVAAPILLDLGSGKKEERAAKKAAAAKV